MGEGVFQMGGGFIFKWRGGVPHRGDIGFDGGISKKIVGWGGGAIHPPPTMGNPVPSVLDSLIRSMIKHSPT